MANRKKTGLSSFKLDCKLEEKTRLIQAEYGLVGFAVVIKLYQKIYGEFGYYCNWNENSVSLFLMENEISQDNREFVNEIVMACLDVNIFSAEMFQKFQILTSRGIQKRYLAGTSRRYDIVLNKGFLLVEIPEGKGVVFDDEQIVSKLHANCTQIAGKLHANCTQFGHNRQFQRGK